MLVDGTATEFYTTVPSHLWGRIVVSPSGCFLAVTGARSGSWHRYPSGPGGRILHRIVWEGVHGPTGDLLVPVVCADRLCIRASHHAPMNWIQAHSFWRQRRSQATLSRTTGPTAKNPHSHITRAAPTLHSTSHESEHQEEGAR